MIYELPRDGRKITLYQQRKGDLLYWYACWRAGRQMRYRYIGKSLPPLLQSAYDLHQQSDAALQSAIQVWDSAQKECAG